MPKPGQEATKTSLILLLLAVVGITGCSKSFDAPADPVTQNIIYLTGNQGGAKWKLSALIVEGIPTDMVAAKIDYHKQYNLNGAFSDSDGITGKWSFVSKDSLVEKFTTYTTGARVSQGYKVSEIDSRHLVLDYDVNGKHVCTKYSFVP